LAPIEYAMLLAFTTAVLMAALTDLGGASMTAFKNACMDLGGTCSNALAFVERTVLNRVP
jgi:Flp pilus assembly pilin Flp